VDLFSQGFALCYCILPLRGLNSAHPLSFEKKKGYMKYILPHLFPLSNSIREGKLKGVSEN
jgi:hypothetical protein